MDEVEFDKFADEYRAMHAANIRITGEDPEYFAEYKVVDIAEGIKPRLPKTWPGLPILIDSPGWSPVFDGHSLAFDAPHLSAKITVHIFLPVRGVGAGVVARGAGTAA